MSVKYYRDPNLPFLEFKNCDSGVHASKEHSHEEFSFRVILKGTSSVTRDGQDYHVKLGMAIIIPPQTVHRCTPANPDCW